ncbi:MAG: MFS transporter [Lachnospiraceae bacterium]|nr:MFS transporter [Lachnospiraceae bacterium]
MNTMEKQTRTSGTLRAVVLVIAACIIHGIMQGIHDNFGIMMKGLVGTAGFSYAYVSFCIGVGALLYGVAQPFLGMLALKKSNAFVILLGTLCTAAGLAISPLCRSEITLMIFFGILLPLGTTGLCFGIVMGAITPFLGKKQAAIVSGIVQASAGIGDALMSPALQTLSDTFGIRTAMTTFAVPFIALIPIVLWLGAMNKNNSIRVEEKEEDTALIPMLKTAFKDRNYRLILLGFGTCGFNMSIIESHLYSQYTAGGISNSAASLTLTVYGIATMVGAVATGYLGTKFRMKNVLAGAYGLRVVISIGFLILPLSAPLAFTASALLGLCGDATVPPTSGIISHLFGARKMAALYGFAMIGHQVGAFASATLGGIFVSQGLGYAPLWIVNLCLAAFASACSYRINL